MPAPRPDADALARMVAALDEDDVISFARALVCDLGERDIAKLHTFTVAMDAAFDLVDTTDDSLIALAANDDAGAPTDRNAPGEKPSPSTDDPGAPSPKRGDDSVH